MQFIVVLTLIDKARYPKLRISVRVNEYFPVFSIILYFGMAVI